MLELRVGRFRQGFDVKNERRPGQPVEHRDGKRHRLMVRKVREAVLGYCWQAAPCPPKAQQSSEQVLRIAFDVLGGENPSAFVRERSVAIDVFLFEHFEEEFRERALGLLLTSVRIVITGKAHLLPPPT